MRARRWLIALWIAVFCCPLRAALPGFEGGHLKGQGQWARYPSGSVLRDVLGSDTLDAGVDARLRFSGRRGGWELRADYQLLGRWGDSVTAPGLVPGLSARENIFLGQETTRAGFIAADEERRRVRKLFDRLGANIDPEVPCGRLSVAEQQEVEIAKALSQNARLIVMDEPTAALSPSEVERLLEVVRELKAQGIGVIYISHRLNEIFEIADRVTVLRDGGHVGTKPIGEFTRDNMIELMVDGNTDELDGIDDDEQLLPAVMKMAGAAAKRPPVPGGFVFPPAGGEDEHHVQRLQPRLPSRKEGARETREDVAPGRRRRPARRRPSRGHARRRGR